ncbi:MAG: hypothetical protein E7534_02565 [Ruminococcaceae bacterium]|nr:hypothetical protein [Oscillospiraceae bacterium]
MLECKWLFGKGMPSPAAEFDLGVVQMKKLLSICLVLTMLLAFGACSTTPVDNHDGGESSTSSTGETTSSTVATGDGAGDSTTTGTAGASSSDNTTGTTAPVGTTGTSKVNTTTSTTKVTTTTNPCKHEVMLPANCDRPATCAECGKTGGKKLGHMYELGECTRVIDGKVCGDYDPKYIPKMYFTGDMSNMTSKKDVREIDFEYRCKETDEKKGEVRVLQGAAKIKVQGTSSLSYDKKNYTINFYEDTSYAKKLGVDVGWGEQTEYCLKANWIDKTHARNVVSAKLVGEMQAKYGLFEDTPNGGAIDGFPIEVYINGDFHGLYTMNIPKADWMFNMDESNPNHIVICGEVWEAANWFKGMPSFDTWAVEVGTENDATLQKMNRLFQFLCYSNDATFKRDFEDYMDLDATLNYYIMMDFGYMPDNRGKNMLIATYDGQYWYPSLYDLDTSWGTYWDGSQLYPYDTTPVEMYHSHLWSNMEKLFSKELAERYFELRETVLDEDHVMKMFTDFYESIPDEVLAREKNKWGPNLPGDDIDQIQDYLDVCVPYLDAKYADWL